MLLGRFEQRLHLAAGSKFVTSRRAHRSHRSACCRASDDDKNNLDIDELAKLLSSKAAELRKSIDESDQAVPVPSSPPTASDAFIAKLEAEVGEGGFSADDFELIRYLGNLSIQSPDGGPDQTTLVVAFIGRCSSGAPYSAPAMMMLKEYLPQGRGVAFNELQLLHRLTSLPRDKWMAVNHPQPLTETPPVITPIGYFLSTPSGPATNFLHPNDAPDAETLWLVYGYAPLRPLSYYIEQGGLEAPQKPPLAFWQSQKDLEAFFVAARRRMLLAITFGLLEALEFCHSKGVAHGAVSSGCVLLNTVEDAEVEGLMLKLDGFGFGRAVRDREAAADDIKAAALVLAELYMVTLAVVGDGGSAPPPVTRQSLQNLMFAVFKEDINRFREYCLEDGQYQRVVEFLDERDRMGWQFLGELVRGRQTAEQLLEHEFLRGGL